MNVRDRRWTGSPATFAWVLAACLALVALPAWALGLGQLRVLSRPGQPLVAEIPVISSDPAELEQLQVRLASPDTFRRVGLEPPDSEVSGLQFAVALDARGNPVVRVTSAAPLQQPLLTFLVEVDWGDGRLVREYSTLVDAPRTVAAPAEPVRAPTVAPPNTIARPAPPPDAVAASAEPLPPADESSAGTAADGAEQPGAVPPTPTPNPAPAPAPAPDAAPAPTPGAALSDDGRYRVRAGDTLGAIVSGMDRAGHTTAQTMLALLRANPEAFINDNINLVRQGAVLRMPPAEELSRYDASEAAAMVRTQIAQWRQARAPQPQPDAVAAAGEGPGAAGARGAASGGASPADGARLEIVPPASSRGGQAGTRSGIEAGGEGDMARQELQQTREALAARDAEVQELKTRVAELEKLQQQQAQLIAMKDSALATAQQDLAKSNAQATTQASPSDAAAAAGATVWPWVALALVVVALAAWLLLRNRRRDGGVAPRRFHGDPADAVPAPRRTGFAAPPPVAPDPAQAPGGDADAMDAFVESRPAGGGAPGVASVAADGEFAEEPASPPDPPQPPHWTAAPALVGTVPTWHSGPECEGEAEERDLADDPARQLELARAYLDLGDDDAARALLIEVMDGRDPAAREQAARMLRDL